jgi:rhodanese-related sulfurtransferase
MVTEEGYTHLDVRTVDEYLAGHPAGAYNIPLMVHDPATGMMRPNTRFLEEVRASFPPGTPLVLSCRSGGRSARAASMLLERGYTSVVDQRAGWDGERDMSGRVVTPGWRSQGLPAETGVGGERGYRARAGKGG